MKCVMCKQRETQPGTTTMTQEWDDHPPIGRSPGRLRRCWFLPHKTTVVNSDHRLTSSYFAH